MSEMEEGHFGIFFLYPFYGQYGNMYLRSKYFVI
jgi:hypothetical protein